MILWFYVTSVTSLIQLYGKLTACLHFWQHNSMASKRTDLPTILRRRIRHFVGNRISLTNIYPLLWYHGLSIVVLYFRDSAVFDFVLQSILKHQTIKKSTVYRPLTLTKKSEISECNGKQEIIIQSYSQKLILVLELLSSFVIHRRKHKGID